LNIAAVEKEKASDLNSIQIAWDEEPLPMAEVVETIAIPAAAVAVISEPADRVENA
jgi:hypothetical protein